MVETGPRARAGEILERAVGRFRAPVGEWQGDLHAGVDLGTASIVIAVIDDAGEPVYLDEMPAAAVRDGVVIDFHAAVEVTTRLRQAAEETLSRPLTAAATAYPPGIGRNESRACQFVLERAGMDCIELVDELSAANAFLGLTDAVLADVGGGSTGVGIIEGGKLERVGDLPGGGHHLDLILAGALKIDLSEAERLKRKQGGDYLQILRPGLERVASNIERLSAGRDAAPVHLAGGAPMIPGAGEVIGQYLERTVVEYPHALYITPLGIALSPARTAHREYS